LALIDRNTDVFASAIETPIAPTALLVGVALVELMLREDAVRNAQHFDFDARHVHRFDGDAVRFRTRQDHAAAGKADISGAVAEGEREGFVEFGAFAGLRRQTLADRDLTLRLQRQATQAQQIARYIDLERRCRLQLQIVCEVDRWVGRKILREFQTRTRFDAIHLSAQAQERHAINFRQTRAWRVGAARILGGANRTKLREIKRRRAEPDAAKHRPAP